MPKPSDAGARSVHEGSPTVTHVSEPDLVGYVQRVVSGDEGVVVRRHDP